MSKIDELYSKIMRLSDELNKANYTLNTLGKGNISTEGLDNITRKVSALSTALSTPKSEQGIQNMDRLFESTSKSAEVLLDRVKKLTAARQELARQSISEFVSSRGVDPSSSAAQAAIEKASRLAAGGLDIGRMRFGSGQRLRMESYQEKYLNPALSQVSVAETSDVAEGKYASIDKAIQYFKDLEAQAGITTTKVQELLGKMSSGEELNVRETQALIREFTNLGSAVGNDSKKLSELQSIFQRLQQVSQINIKAGKDVNIAEEEAQPLYATYTGDWKQGLKDFDMYGKKAAENGELMNNIRESLSSIAKEHGTLINSESGFKVAIDGTNRSLIVQYQEVKKIGDVIATLPKQTAELDYSGRLKSAMSTPMTFTGVAQTDYVTKNAGYIKSLYANVRDEVTKVQEEIKQRGGISLGQEPSVRVNEITGEVEILVRYMEKLSDSTTVAREEFKKLRAASPGKDATLTSPTSRLSGIQQLFGGGEAATTFTQNFQKAVESAGMSVDNVTGAYKDQASEITRISLASVDLEGNTKKLTLSFDKNGQQVVDNSSRYSKFNDAIGQVTTRLIRYTIAANLVYGAFNKISEIPGIIAEVGDSLARLANLTNLGAEAASQYYDKALSFANKYKMDVTEVLKSSQMIFQVTGRNDTAESLQILDNAMIYAKLSGEDLSGSVDVLISVMNQFDMSAKESAETLAKWYDISKRVGTSVSAIGESFAIAGSVAKESGVGEDLLTAITAQMIQATPMTAREVGNLNKTIFTNLTSEASIQELEKYGIRVKDTLTGAYRDAGEIMDEIYMRIYKYNTVPETATKDIAATIGGGPRRGPQVLTEIQQWGDIRIQEKMLEGVSGTEALQDAMEGLQESLQSDLADLNNAFTDLAKSIGDAGLEDILRNLIHLATQMVDLVKLLTDGMSGGGMATAITTIAMVALNFKNLAAGITGSKLAADLLANALLNVGAAKQQISFTTSAGGFMGAELSTEGPTTKLNPANMQMYGQVFGLAASNAIATYIGTGDAGQAAASGLASAFGAALGSQFGPVGMIIGSQVASVIAQYIGQAIKTETEETAFLEKYSGRQLSTADYEEIITKLNPQTEQDYEDIARKLGGFGSEKGATNSAGGGFWGAGKGGMANRQAQAVSTETERYLEGIRGAGAARDAEAAQAEAVANAEELLADATLERIEALKEQLFPDTNPQSAALVENLRKQAFQRRVSGESGFGASKYKGYMEALETDALTRSVDLADLLGEEMGGAFQVFEKYLPILADAGEEERSFLGDVVMSAQAAKSAWIEGTGSLEDYTNGLQQVRDVLGLLEQSYKDATLSSLELVSPVDVRDRLKEEIDTAYKFGLQYQRALAKQSGFTEEQYQQFTEAIPEITLRIGDFEFENLEGLKQELFEMGLEWGDEVNKGMEDSFNIRRLPELDESNIPELEQRNAYWSNYLAKAQGYQNVQEYQKAKPEDFQEFNLVLGENNVLYKMLSTNEAMNFTLEDILDTEKKQLEGMWNIPEGATFWVPLQSVSKQKEESGMYPNLPPVQAIAPTTPLDLLLNPADILLEAGNTLLEAGNNLNKPEEETKKATPSWRALEKMLLSPATAKTEEPLSGHFTTQDYYGIYPQSSAVLEAQKSFEPVSRSMEDVIAGAFAGGNWRGQQMQPGNVVVNVPETKTEVESNLSVTLKLAETTLTKVIQRLLSKQLNKTTNKRSYTVPMGMK